MEVYEFKKSFLDTFEIPQAGATGVGDSCKVPFSGGPRVWAFPPLFFWHSRSRLAVRTAVGKSAGNPREPPWASLLVH